VLVSKDISDKFFSIYYPLLYYGNSYFNIYKNINNSNDMFSLKPDKLYKIRNQIFAIRNVIDSYIRDNSQILEEENVKILKIWKKEAKNLDLFYYQENNKSVFYNIDLKEKLNIYGLTDDPDNIEILKNYPLIVSSIVLPLNNYLIWDGLFSISEISKDKRIKEVIREIIISK